MYIVGYLRDRCAGERLSFTDANGTALEQVLPGPEGCRVYSPAGVSITLTSTAGGFGGRSGLYDVSLPIKVMTKSGHQLAHPGDSIDLAHTHFVLISGLQLTLLKSIFFLYVLQKLLDFKLRAVRYLHLSKPGWKGDTGKAPAFQDFSEIIKVVTIISGSEKLRKSPENPSYA